MHSWRGLDSLTGYAWGSGNQFGLILNNKLINLSEVKKRIGLYPSFQSCETCGGSTLDAGRTAVLLQG